MSVNLIPNSNQIRAELDALINTCNRQVLGNPQAVKFALTAFLAGGHLLIEDLPGLKFQACTIYY